MSILLTGGTGKTASRLARLLQAANKRIILTSRKGVVPEPFTGVKFDWHDPTTFENPFTVDADITSVYLVAPTACIEVLGPMRPFIDLAVKQGVKRFVFLSESTYDAGDPVLGKVHEYLINLGVDYFVIRPTWFFENFLTLHLRNIMAKSAIITASGDGKIGFTSADDIADLAFDALTRAESYNTAKFLVGPELLSYDDVAKTFSEVLGRTISHTRISVDEVLQYYISLGLPVDYAAQLASLETVNANGVEEERFASPNTVYGKRTVRSFVEAHKDAWKV